MGAGVLRGIRGTPAVVLAPLINARLACRGPRARWRVTDSPGARRELNAASCPVLSCVPVTARYDCAECVPPYSLPRPVPASDGATFRVLRVNTGVHRRTALARRSSREASPYSVAFSTFRRPAFGAILLVFCRRLPEPS